MFQSYALFPNMTVFQNIEAGIQRKKAAKRERAMEMMEKFHLSELASGLSLIHILRILHSGHGDVRQGASGSESGPEPC